MGPDAMAASAVTCRVRWPASASVPEAAFASAVAATAARLLGSGDRRDGLVEAPLGGLDGRRVQGSGQGRHGLVADRAGLPGHQVRAQVGREVRPAGRVELILARTASRLGRRSALRPRLLAPALACVSFACAAAWAGASSRSSPRSRSARSSRPSPTAVSTAARASRSACSAASKCSRASCTGRHGQLLALVELADAVRDGDGGQGGVRGIQVADRLPGGFGRPGGLVPVRAQLLEAALGRSHRLVGPAGYADQPFRVLLQRRPPRRAPGALLPVLAGKLQRGPLRAASQRLPGSRRPLRQHDFRRCGPAPRRTRAPARRLSRAAASSGTRTAASVARSRSSRSSPAVAALRS